MRATLLTHIWLNFITLMTYGAVQLLHFLILLTQFSTPFGNFWFLGSTSENSAQNRRFLLNVLFKDAFNCRGYRTSDDFTDVLDKNLLVTVTYLVHDRKLCRDFTVERHDVNVTIGKKRTGCLIIWKLMFI